MRGSTDNLMDGIERTVDDGINTFKCLTKDARFVPGAGATEIELAKQLASYGEVGSLFTVEPLSQDGHLLIENTSINRTAPNAIFVYSTIPDASLPCPNGVHDREVPPPYVFAICGYFCLRHAQGWSSMPSRNLPSHWNPYLELLLKTPE